LEIMVEKAVILSKYCNFLCVVFFVKNKEKCLTLYYISYIKKYKLNKQSNYI